MAEPYEKVPPEPSATDPAGRALFPISMVAACDHSRSKAFQRGDQAQVAVHYQPEHVEEALRTAADAMFTIPARHPVAVTVREICDFFDDSHVHAALIVSSAGYLAAVVERDDIANSQAPDDVAAPLGRLAGHRAGGSQPR